MTTFNYTQIKTITINVDNGVWNPDKHNILLSYDPTSANKLSVKLIPIEDTLPIVNMNMAENVLKQFRLNK